MPTNLKSLLTRSRSKNELKLRESKDEISPSGDSESSSGDNGGGDDDRVCSNAKCECSGHQLKDDCGCCRNGSESCLCSSGGRRVAGSYLYSNNESDTENNCFPNNDLSYNSGSYGRCDESGPSEHSSCYSEENFLKSLNSSTTACSTTLSTMMPPGNSFHHHHHLQQQRHHNPRPYQCCSQQSYASPAYDMVGSIGVGVGGAAAGNGGGPVDYCGYYVEEKSNAPRMMRMMDGRDNDGVEMRRNASCRTLFLSSNNTLHQPTCTYESGLSHMEPPPPHPPTLVEFSSPHASSSMGPPSGKVAAVPAPLHHVGPSFLRSTAEGCGSSGCECESPAAVPCCTFNMKDGSSCQSLSMRKCETVLALSSLNNGTISTTTTPITTTSGSKSSSSYGRNAAAAPAAGMGTYPIYPGGTAAAASLTSSGTTMSHLSSSSGGVPANGSNGGGKVRGMKEKIFSTSSSALNCLLHSSSRTGKLFSGWKLGSGGGGSSNGGSNMNVANMFSGSSEGSNCLGVNCQPNKHFLGASSVTSDNNKLGSTASARGGSHHHHQKSRSQLSISENSFSSSPAPLTPVNRLRRNVSVNNTSSFCPSSGSLSAHSSYSRSSSVASFIGWKEKEERFEQSLFCRLCLSYVRLEETMEILACSCRYCKDCLISYVSFEIQEGADEIACPDASCEKQGVLGLHEVEQLVSPMLMEKHKKFRLFREVEKDNKLMWCPSPGCETVCQIQTGSGILTAGFVPEIDRAHGGAAAVVAGAGGSRSLPFISCPTCQKTHCAGCQLSWHPDSSCESFRRKLIKQGKLSTEDDELFSLDSIKKCPFCHVPIEKDSGCAQMMCKRCKHVFCWYCLASLDDDFLLRHYDKGPCKNKLGHSRASVVWHRAQVIGIFAGFGVLVLLASPLLILAAPCLLCCRCRYCANKLDPEESDLV